MEMFNKEYYLRAIENEKKQEFYCEVAIRDFKGNIALLRDLCANISNMGIKCDSFGHEDNYKGYAIISHASLSDIEKLYKRYKVNLYIDGNMCDYTSYKRALAYALKKRENRIKKYEEILKQIK